MKAVVGIIAVVIGFLGYSFYLKGIFRGQTRPHFFSWFLWGVLISIVFFAQVVSHAGPGAWVSGFSATVCFLVAGLALKKGQKDVTKLDWVCFVGALLGIGLWIVTDEPLTAVIIVALVDAIAFIPTFRKSYLKPEQETALAYGCVVLKNVFSLFALETVSLVTWLSPVSFILTNGSFTLMLLIRRRSILRSK